MIEQIVRVNNLRECETAFTLHSVTLLMSLTYQSVSHSICICKLASVVKTMARSSRERFVSVQGIVEEWFRK